MIKSIPRSSVKVIFEKVRNAGFPIHSTDQNIELAIHWLSRIELDERISQFEDGKLTQLRAFKNLDIRWHLSMVKGYGHVLDGSETVECVIETHQRLKQKNSI